MYKNISAEIELIGNVLTVKSKSENDLSPRELAEIIGYLQIYVSLDALKNGADIEDIKSAMLDIHLAAMESLEKNRKEVKK